MNQACYQDTVLINICFLHNMRNLFWQECIECKIYIIKILNLQYFFFVVFFLFFFLLNDTDSATFITLQIAAMGNHNFIAAFSPHPSSIVPLTSRYRII